MTERAQADDAPFHVGLTPELVIDEATALTRETHLLGWSVRDLASRLDVATSVLYHHVGGKDVIVHRVVERILADLPVPDASLEWQCWFREFILPGHKVIAMHTGVARWLLTHSPTMPQQLLPGIERGSMVLQRAGFGKYAAVAYAMILSNALSAIAVDDDRRLNDPRDLAALRAALTSTNTDRPTIELFIASLVDPFLTRDDAGRESGARYIGFILETTMAGLEVLRDRGWPRLV